MTVITRPEPQLIKKTFKNQYWSGGSWVNSDLFLGSGKQVLEGVWEYKLGDSDSVEIDVRLIEFPKHFYYSSKSKGKDETAPNSPLRMYGSKVIDAVVDKALRNLQENKDLVDELESKFVSQLLFAPRSAHAYHFWLDKISKEPRIDDKTTRTFVNSLRERVMLHLYNNLQFDNPKEIRYFFDAMYHSHG